MSLHCQPLSNFQFLAIKTILHTLLPTSISIYPLPSWNHDDCLKLFYSIFRSLIYISTLLSQHVCLTSVICFLFAKCGCCQCSPSGCRNSPDKCQLWILGNTTIWKKPGNGGKTKTVLSLLQPYKYKMFNINTLQCAQLSLHPHSEGAPRNRQVESPGKEWVWNKKWNSHKVNSRSLCNRK